MMKCRTFLFCLGVAGFLALAFTPVNSVWAQGTAFTYQGRMDVNSSAASGNFDMQFKLHPAGSTNLIGPILISSPVGVTNGLFTVALDFGNVFDGTVLFLEVGLRPTGSLSNYTILSPTQPLTPTPYAVRASSVNAFTGTIADSQLSTNIARFTTGGGFTGPVVLNGSGSFSGTLSGTFNGTTTGTNLGTFIGTTTGTNIGTFVGNGAAVTNVNITNVVGIVQSNPNWQLLQSAQLAVVGNNYLSTNNAALTLTLPASPGIGSIVRISGSGANGWVVSPNASQSILTANLGLPAGQSWSGYSNSQAWKAVASSATGINLAAAYGTGFIYYSHDGGLSWNKSDAPSKNWLGIASSADGLRMVAVPNGDLAYTSTNGGSNWISQAGTSAFYNCVASSADGIKLVAASGSGADPIYTSSNGGTTWTTRTVAGTSWTSVASSADGTKLVAVASGSSTIYTSSDSGVTWTNHGPANSWTGVASSADGTKLVATLNGGNIYTSGDSGVTWTARASSQTWKCVTSSADGVNLAAAYGLGYLYTSNDSGQTWVQRTNYVPGGTQSWSAISSSANGSRLLAAQSTGNVYTSVAATTVGGGTLAGTQYSSLELQYVGNGQWMPLGSTGSFKGN
ncbi:MAG: hypothetical protein JWQ04_480 [Pedosphaera sp.]|nr:hypothetical protein [Pedosphaera sp.]